MGRPSCVCPKIKNNNITNKNKKNAINLLQKKQNCYKIAIAKKLLNLKKYIGIRREIRIINSKFQNQNSKFQFEGGFLNGKGKIWKNQTTR